MTRKSKLGAKPAAPESVPISQEEIIAMLAARAGEMKNLRTTTAKIPTLRKILSKAAGELPPNTKLPGIRDLCACLNSSLVTIQRTITDLVTEGVLYSRPRSGIFVRERVGQDAFQGSPFSASTGQAARHPFRTGFDFGTDSTAPYQREFWEQIAAAFCKQHPNTAPSLHFEAGMPNDKKPLDVFERYEWHRHHKDDLKNTVDIAKFAGDLLPISPTSNGLLPLYYRTYFLFFNSSLLERHGLPLPDYRTFQGQADYLRRVAPELSRLGYNPKPYSIQEPVTLFGGQISQFAKFFDSSKPQPALRKSLIKATENLIEFCNLCRYSLKDRYEWVQAHDEFLKGQSPFFMGYSVDYWEFSQKNLPFSIGAYPTLCGEDTFFLWSRVGAVASHSEHPVESINFLTFLLRPEIQERFAATGNFGANPVGDLYPAMSADPAWVTSVLKKSTPFSLATKEQYYVTVNVLGGEIWRSLLEEISAEEILDRAAQLGRSYLQHRSTKRPVNPALS